MEWKLSRKKLTDLTDRELVELYYFADPEVYRDSRTEEQWILLMDETKKKGK